MEPYTKKCGAECELCDCGRSDNQCKFLNNKRMGRRKAIATKLVTEKRVVTTYNPKKKKESKADKKKRRKKGK